MGRNEWLVACAVAGLAILAVVAAGLPPMTWATPTTPAVVVPGLPPAALDIPALEARVSAVATMDPSLPVKVKLTVTAPSARAGERVPVTLTVSSMSLDMRDMMSRSTPRFSPPPQAAQTQVTRRDLSFGLSQARQVAHADASIQIGPDGTGSAVVELPLVWAPSSRPATQPDNAARPALAAGMITTYQMVLSSPLVKGSAVAGQLLKQPGAATQNGNIVR